MSWFLAVLALAGWYQAIRIGQDRDRILRAAYRETNQLEGENLVLRQQLAAAQHWHNDE
ncbi:hypothetical protein D3C85_960080 [compost metagenome]